VKQPDSPLSSEPTQPWLAAETPNNGSAPAQSPSDSLPSRQPSARERDVEVDQFLDDPAADLIDR
jgi:hypothetical protein